MKIGDRVRIRQREDRWGNQEFYRTSYTDMMMQYANEEYEIGSEVLPGRMQLGRMQYFKLKGNVYLWHPDWLEKIYDFITEEEMTL